MPCGAEVIIVLLPMLVPGAALLPAVAMAALAAAAALGYTVSRGADRTRAAGMTEVDVKIENAETVTEDLRLGQQLILNRDGITLVFSRDRQGRAVVRAAGCGMTQVALRAAAEEFISHLTQQYAYHRLMTKLRQKDFTVIEESVEADRTVHVRVSVYRD